MARNPSRQVDLRNRMNSGAQADTILDHPVFLDAVRSVEADYKRAWETSAPGDQEAREQAYYAMNALKDIVKALRKVASDGLIAKMELDEEQRELMELIDGR